MNDDDLQRMLRNWALWRCGSGRGGMGYAASSYDLEARGRRAEVAMPVIDGEALDVDRLVSALPFAQRQALHARYLGELIIDLRSAMVPRETKPGQDNPFHPRRIPSTYSDDQVARWLGCSRRTYARRLDDAGCEIRYQYAALRRRWIA